MLNPLFPPPHLLALSPETPREDLSAQDGWGLFLLAGIVAVLVVGAFRLWMKTK